MNSPANYIDPNGMIPWSWQRNGETAVQYSMRMYNQDMYDMMYLGGVGIGGGGAMDKTKLSYLVQTGYIGTKYELYDYYIDYYSEPNGQGDKGGTRYLGSIWEPTNQAKSEDPTKTNFYSFDLEILVSFPSENNRAIVIHKNRMDNAKNAIDMYNAGNMSSTKLYNSLSQHGQEYHLTVREGDATILKPKELNWWYLNVV